VMLIITTWRRKGNGYADHNNVAEIGKADADDMEENAHGDAHHNDEEKNANRNGNGNRNWNRNDHSNLLAKWNRSAQKYFG